MPFEDEKRETAYLWDILDAARTATQFTNGLTVDDYLKDRKLQLAIERLIEIIGEAAKRISPQFKAEHAEIPWRKIVAQRNVIAHEYGEIKQERIWTVVSVNIPELIACVKPIVESVAKNEC